jgi:hypothetical protein
MKPAGRLLGLDAIEDTAVIYSWYAARLIWQQRLDGEPLAVGEFVAHEFKLHFGGLNHSLATGGDASSEIGCRLFGAKRTIGKVARISGLAAAMIKTPARFRGAIQRCCSDAVAVLSAIAFK